MKNNKARLFAAPTLALCSVPCVLLAQDGGAVLALEEVVVTAQKREESLQEVPISISALSGDMLEAKNVFDTTSFSNLVPNLQVRQGVGGDVMITIRGINGGLTSNIGFENAVGTYVDGVYTGKGLGSLLELGDVERIEVLRGPQGTLYGRNAIGGAINYISVRPTGEFSGKLKAGVGNSDLRYGNLNLNSPSLGTSGEGLGAVAARLSYFTRQREGFTKLVDQNLSPMAVPAVGIGDTLGDLDREAAHLAIDWDLRENLLLEYSFMTSSVDDTPRLQQVMDAQPGTPTEPYVLPRDEYPDKASLNNRVYYRTDVDAHTLTATWDINEELTFKSITGYRETEVNERFDIDGTNIPLNEDVSTFEHEQLSQELQLVGLYDTLKFTTGLYYFREEGESQRATAFYDGLLFVRKGARLDNSNFAAYGQVDWNATERLTLSLGGRYTTEDKQMDRYIHSIFGGFDEPLELIEQPYDLILPEIEFSDSSYMWSANYNISDEVHTYVKYSEGFRSGGYDGSTSSPAAAAMPFGSEDLTSYEVGLKSFWWDRRAQVNLSAFFNEYDEMQLSSFDGSVISTLNAGKSELQGLELETALLLGEHLSATFNLALLSYDILEFDMGVYGDAADNAEFANAPELTYNLGVDYWFGRVASGDLSLNLNYSYSAGSHQIAIQSNGEPPNSKTNANHLLDARLTLGGIQLGSGMELSASLWGQNLADEAYFDNVIDLNLLAGFRVGSMGYPRTYGMEVSVSF